MVVQLHNLTKKNGRYMYLDNLSFTVPKGSIYALIGPNGSGKSSALKCVNNEVFPSSGSVTVFGNLSPAQAKARIAKVNEHRDALARFTGNDYIELWAHLYPGFNKEKMRQYCVPARIALSKRADLYPVGQRTLFFNALAIASNADLVILDEPFQHLDPLLRTHLARMMRNYVTGGEKTILLSSHEVLEIEELATAFTILRHGECLYSATLDEAKSTHRVVDTASEPAPSVIVGMSGHEIVVHSSLQEGRAPRLRDIVLAYLGNDIPDS